MASILTLQLHAISFPRRISPNALSFDCCQLNWRNDKLLPKKFVLRALKDENNGNQDKAVESVKDKVFDNTQYAIAKFRESVSSVPHILVTKRIPASYIGIGVCVATMFLVIVMRVLKARSARSSRPGSVADLVRRGQLRSDRRGISSTLNYDDPFNNPLVKIAKNNSSVEMCGKVYRLEPITLTREQQSDHVKRRSRAYQWKRPTIFLKEGDDVPPDVDPDTIRWIPANHPFATTVSDIGEDLAQNNMHQKHGVPSRIKAEHEALQRKLESLQNEDKLSTLNIDPDAAKNFERPFKTQSRPDDQVQEKPSNGDNRNSLRSNTNTEDLHHM